MNTAELQHVLRTDPGMSRFSVGVFPSDKIPKNTPGCMIINEDTHRKPGSHWIALFVRGDDICEYFDSYGRKPAATGVKRFLAGQQDVLEITRKLQAPMATSCGQHCLYFLYHRCRGVSYSDIVDSYSPRQAENDELVTSFINDKFDLENPTTDASFLWHQISTLLA